MTSIRVQLLKTTARATGGLALDQEQAQHGADARCGLHIIDLRNGRHGPLGASGRDGQRLLYDVAILPDVTRPSLFGFKSDDIPRTIEDGDAGVLCEEVRQLLLLGPGRV